MYALLFAAGLLLFICMYHPSETIVTIPEPIVEDIRSTHREPGIIYRMQQRSLASLRDINDARKKTLHAAREIEIAERDAWIRSRCVSYKMEQLDELLDRIRIKISTKNKTRLSEDISSAIALSESLQEIDTTKMLKSLYSNHTE